MRTAKKMLDRFLRLAIITSAVLALSPAHAAGTDPGVDVDNTATVSFSVNGNAQSEQDTASFVVDRRVDFIVDRMNSALTDTTLSATDQFLDFWVKNTSNGTLDFNLSFAQLVTADGDIHGGGTADTGASIGDVDMSNVRISVGPDFVADGLEGTGNDPLVTSTDPYIDDLPEDFSVRVRLYADTPGTLANLDRAGLRLIAVAAEPSGSTASPGADLAESATWREAEIDNVFADTSEDNNESAIDGFRVLSAQVVVTKIASVISDPINGVSAAARAIPGAIIEYVVTIDNSAGNDSADAISIVDDIDTDVSFVTGAANVTIFDGTTTTTCEAEAGGTDTNTDGCVYDSTTPGRLLVTSPALTAVGVGEIWTVSYRVEIPVL